VRLGVEVEERAGNTNYLSLLEVCSLPSIKPYILLAVCSMEDRCATSQDIV